MEVGQVEASVKATSLQFGGRLEEEWRVGFSCEGWGKSFGKMDDRCRAGKSVGGRCGIQEQVGERV